MPKTKSFLIILFVFLIPVPWIYITLTGSPVHSPWNALLPGIAIFGAAFILSWGAELAQLEIPQSLALAFLALIAVLPEYAVDAYFAWEAAKNPDYIHYATANMTGANRLLIGVGWATVVITYYFKSKKRWVELAKENRLELLALTLATAYCFIIPIKKTISYIDSAILLSIFAWYIYRAAKSHHEEPEIEDPIQFITQWKRPLRILATLFLFSFAGYAIFISAEPFAEGLLETGRHFKIEEFILVQWIAPLASESPEFIVAILFALKLKAKESLTTLISSKVNQWTLLIGMLPLIYSLSAGQLQPMHLDARQAEEIFLTAAQGLFALVIIVNLRFSIMEALLLFVLFASQLFFTSTEARQLYAFGYVAISLAWLVCSKATRQAMLTLLTSGFKKKII